MRVLNFAGWDVSLQDTKPTLQLVRIVVLLLISAQLSQFAPTANLCVWHPKRCVNTRFYLFFNIFHV